MRAQVVFSSLLLTAVAASAAVSLLRNDEVTSLFPLAPPRAAIFKGRAATRPSR